MAGIYIHIPFCKQACSYCNFHFSTSLKYKNQMVDAICTEIKLRHKYLTEKTLSSIYFGGGTPSLLSIDEFNKIINTLSLYYIFKDDIEITLEANPDDLSIESLNKWQSTVVNRLSIGVQSFESEDLIYMNRAHNKDEAINCIKNALDVGFDNLSIDLIYGTPSLSDEKWKNNIQILLDFNITHISAYALTIEEKTLLSHQINKKNFPAPSEEKASRQYTQLMQMLDKHGYEHYEISNFCLPDKYALHNTNYWKGVNYLGIGPSAHSFNGHSRGWNIANNAKYMKHLKENKLPYEEEGLSTKDQYNEYIMTGLRTQWGINTSKIHSFGPEISEHFFKEMENLKKDNHFAFQKDGYILNNQGKLIADRLISTLFYV